MKIAPNIPFHENRFLMFVMDEMANDFEKNHDDVIRMTLGKSEYSVSEPVLRAMQDASLDFARSALVFPAGLPELKDRIAAYYMEVFGVEVPAKNVVISVGTSMSFRNIFYLLLAPGDEVVLPLPYYSLYQFSAAMVDAKIRHYSIDTSSLTIDFDSLECAITERTRVVVLNSPGNPLGNVLSREDLRRVDEIVGGRAVVISDEIYRNISFDAPALSALELGETHSSFIVTNSFSKGYRMYSRRVGYAIVPDELVTPMTVIQHHTLLTADPVPQFGAIAALDRLEDVRYLESLYRERRDYTVERFTEVKGVSALRAAGSFYLTLDCASFMECHCFTDSLSLARAIMEETRVATVPGSDFGLPHTLRLSYTNHKYNEGIDRLVHFFRRVPGT